MKVLLSIIATLFLTVNAQASFMNDDPWEQSITPEGAFDDGMSPNGWETMGYGDWLANGYPKYDSSIEFYTCDSKNFDCTCRSKRDCRNLERDKQCIGGTQVCSEIVMGNPLFPSRVWQCTCDWKERPKG